MSESNSGLLVLVFGIIIVLLNSIDYLLGMHKIPKEMTLVGILLMAGGLYMSRNAKRIKH